MEFGQTVGLPLCLKDMGVDNIKEVADRAGKELENDHFMVNLICDHSPGAVTGAILHQQFLADSLRKNGGEK